MCTVGKAHDWAWCYVEEPIVVGVSISGAVVKSVGSKYLYAPMLASLQLVPNESDDVL